MKRRSLNNIPLVIGCLLSILPSTVLAISSAQKQVFENGIYYFNTELTANSCSSVLSGTNNGTVSNLDYAGRTILNQGELKALSDNAATYQQAASQVGIPWQVLAAVHYRETDFSLQEPSNGQGLFQIVDSSKHTPGDYPPAGTELSADQFLGQSIDAAKFLKSDGGGLDAQSQVPAIKDTFVKYNGEPKQYINQATALGFSSDQGYEGSPYVMNIADKPRDPSNGPLSNWLQDQGGGNYHPATADQYGAYVVFASISGQTVSGNCAGGGVACDSNPAGADLSSVRQNVVCIAEDELAKWQGGQLSPGTGFLSYSQNSQEDWCADFASWVYNQAGYPLGSGSDWRISAVSEIKTIGQKEQNFHWHPSGSYTPKPGDLAIHNNGSTDYHVNIVIGVNGDQLTLIGGNQSSYDFHQSNVSEVTASKSSDIAGFVSPD